MSRETDALFRLESEDKIPLKQAIQLFKESPPSLRALQRCVLKGTFCATLGEKVYLEAYRGGTGRSWITSRQAVRRFLIRKNGGDA